MGGFNFFSRIAQHDPLAQAVHLPGYNDAQQHDLKAATTDRSAGGAFSGVTPTLADANAGYVRAAQGAAANAAGAVPKPVAPAVPNRMTWGQGGTSPYQSF